jgi:transcriptional regulator of arginine metabolism
MTRRQRLERILELIAEEEISTQEMLRDRLEEEGVFVTQATLSRDIRELELIKERKGMHRSCYAAPKKTMTPEVGNSIWKNATLRTDFAGNMAVIHCRTGTAQAVAAALDATEPAEVVGTIAGDDTIFVLLRSEAAAEAFAESFAKRMETGGYSC